MDEVWLVEADDYDSFVAGVYDSLQTAVAAIKKPYDAPYIVRWEEPEKTGDDEFRLTGQFSRVDGYCGDGPTSWLITRWTVETLKPAR